MNSKKLVVSICTLAGIILIGAVFFWFQFKPKVENKTNALPPEKQAIEDRYAQERAEGQKNPAPKNSQIATSTVITLGQEFILKTGEIARVGNTEHYLQLQQYRDINNPTHFEYTFVAPEGYPLISEQVPYDVVVKDTDYKNYAKLVVISADNACATKTGLTLDQCWNKLAQRLTNESYCNKIKSQDVKDGCFEYIAANSNDPAQFCQKVVSPKLYCQIFFQTYWKTLHSSSYGLSFKYPSGLFSASIQNDGSMGTSLNPDYAGPKLSGISVQILPFSTKFSPAMDSYGLRYDQNTDGWTRATSGYNLDTYDNFVPSCEKVTLVGAQQVSAYDVSYKYKREYIIILRQGLLDTSEVPVEEPIPPEAHKTFDMMLSSITFDNPESVIKAKCN